MKTRSLQGDTVDLLVWRQAGRTGGLVEAVLDGNRGLAARGQVLPDATPVTIPEAAAAPVLPVVRLWD